MSLIAARLKQLLSGSRVSAFVFLLAFLARAMQLLFFYNIRVDASYQVMATDNLLHGHGVTTDQVFATDLSQIVYLPLTQWPPGYSLLLAPFYALFDHQYIGAGLALDLLATLALLIFCRKLLVLFKTPSYLINLFTLVHGFFLYYFYFIASSDAIAIAFFIGGIYYLFAFLKESRVAKGPAAAMTVCLFIAGLIKYLFIPVVLLVPAVLVALGLGRRKPRWWRTGAFSFLLLSFLLGGLLLYIKWTSGAVAYISAPDRGWFPQHLTELYPFLTASFVKPDTVGFLLNGDLNVLAYRLMQVVSVLLLVYAGYILYQKIKAKRSSAADLYFSLAWLLSTAILLELAVLSLIVAKEEILPGVFWTYVEEPRYYGLVYVMVHLGLFIRHQYHRVSKRIATVAGLLLLLLLPEMFRGVIFVGNRIQKLGRERYSWQAEKSVQDYAATLVKDIRRQYPERMVVITGASYYYNHRIRLTSHVPVLYDGAAINQPALLKTRKPVVLLVLLHNDRLQNYQPFLRRYQRAAIGTFADFSFYAIPLEPQ